jgi:succinate dehydrogenase / fumarate reductase, flavoprotein subunit
MKEKATIKPDVIVVGAGLAGMVAALFAEAEGAQVLLIDKGAVGTGSNSAMSNGVFTAPTQTFSPEDFVRETLEAGKGINHMPTVKLMAREGPGMMDALRSFGVGLETSVTSYVVHQPRADVIRGLTLVRELAAHVKQRERIAVLTGFYITGLPTADGRILGVEGFDTGGADRCFHAPAVIMAAGGGGAIYLRNDNQRSIMGQGYAICARAGLDLWDMEFVQFYPMVIDEPRLPSVMLYAPYPPGTKIIDARGEDISRKHGFEDLSNAIRRKRDAISEMVYTEGRLGPVSVDFRSVSAEQWTRYPLSLLGKIKFDFKNRPVRITPGAHYFVGGVRVDAACETSVKGLFACGELVWGLHGANRRGGNALTECAVYGKTAGQNAAGRSGGQPPLSATPKPEGVTPTSSPVDLKDLRRQIREIAWDHAGVLRNETGLNQGFEKLIQVEEVVRTVRSESVRERKLAADVAGAALTLRSILTASIHRKESRGTFCREDHPAMDDLHWKVNSRLRYRSETGEFDVSHHPAVES